MKIPAWAWPVYLLLFALSIPWYLPSAASPPLWFGLPYWVVLSLGTCVAIALFTACLLLLPWSSDKPVAGTRHTGTGPT